MDTNECYFGLHATCSAAEFCTCLCHAEPEELLEELDTVLDRSDTN